MRLHVRESGDPQGPPIVLLHAFPLSSAMWEPQFEALKSWRRERADALGVPAYTVFADKALWAIADAAPRTEADLLAVSGIGPAKLAAFGDEVLALVRAHAA